jgi:hypothetical protein
VVRLVALLAVLVFPATANASLPRAHPPDTAALAAHGVQIEWP